MKDLEKNVDSGSKATHPPILRIVRISLTTMKQSHQLLNAFHQVQLQTKPITQIWRKV